MYIQKIMRKVVLPAQILGFMPISGTMQEDIHHLRFSWKSWRTIYAVLTLVGMIFIISNHMKKTILLNMNMVDIYKYVTYMGALSAVILFIRLAKDWPRFIKNWTAVEMAMARYGSPAGLNKKVNRILIVLLVLSLVHYPYTQLHALMKVYQCKATAPDKFKSFLRLRFASICNAFECNYVAGVLLLFTNTQIIFSHALVDVFIMVISLSLAARINQVTKRVKSTVIAAIESEDVWIKLREDYNRLECLCKFINSHISGFIILSFVRNLFMVLIQLFNSLKERGSVLEKIYFYYTLGFLLTRTLFVCILGSAVSDESKKSLIYLYKVSDNAYNIEVDRLIRQVSDSNMALSGSNFFRIRRDLVLKIAGALVTYELILIQFAGDTIKTENNNSTSC